MRPYYLGATDPLMIEENMELSWQRGVEAGSRDTVITLGLTTIIGATIGYFMAGSDGTVRGTIIGAAAGIAYRGALGHLA